MTWTSLYITECLGSQSMLRIPKVQQVQQRGHGQETPDHQGEQLSNDQVTHESDQDLYKTI